MTDTRPDTIKCPGCGKSRKAPAKAATSSCRSCGTMVALKEGAWTGGTKADSSAILAKPKPQAADAEPPTHSHALAFKGQAKHQKCPYCDARMSRPSTQWILFGSCKKCHRGVENIEGFFDKPQPLKKESGKDLLECEKCRNCSHCAENDLVGRCRFCKAVLQNHDMQARQRAANRARHEREKAERLAKKKHSKPVPKKHQGSAQNSGQLVACPKCKAERKPPKTSGTFICRNCKASVSRNGPEWTVVEPSPAAGHPGPKNPAHQPTAVASSATKIGPIASATAGPGQIVCPGCQTVRDAPKTIGFSTCRKCQTSVYKNGDTWTLNPPPKLKQVTIVHDGFGFFGFLITVAFGYLLVQFLQPTEMAKLISHFDYGGLVIVALLIPFLLGAVGLGRFYGLFLVFMATFMIAFEMRDLPRGWSPSQFDSDKFMAELKLPSMPSLPSFLSFGGSDGPDMDDVIDDHVALAKQASNQGNHKKAAGAFGIAGAAAASQEDLDVLEEMLKMQAIERQRGGN